MPGFDPIAAMTAYHAAVDAHDLPAIAAWFAEEAVYASAGLGQIAGKAAIMAAMKSYFLDHPDHHSWDESIEASGPRSALARWHITATHAATGRLIRRQGVEVLTFGEDGLIARVEVEDQVADRTP